MHLKQKKGANGAIEMEKHEAVVSGIMSSVGFDTLELSDQTTKVLAESMWCMHMPVIDEPCCAMGFTSSM
jgi:hypothetical protein